MTKEDKSEMSGQKRLGLIIRSAYGAKNAFSPLIGVIEETKWYKENKIKILLTEEDPRPQARQLSERGYNVIILYGLSTLVYLDLRDEIRSVATEYRIVAGGPHVEGAYWHVLRDGVDIAVVGDGEPALEAIVEYYMGYREKDDIPNIAFWDGSRFKVTRIIHIDLDDYKGYSDTMDLYPPIEIMRGCHNTCKFCQVPWLFKKKVRYRSTWRVLDIARHYIVKGNRRRIRFTAPIGFAYMSPGEGVINHDAIEEILRGVRRLGGIPFLGSFPSETRPEYIDRRVLRIVRKYAGNKKISVGLQTGSDRLLSSMRRGHSVKQALDAARLILEEGFVPVIDILFGLPGETEDDVEATIEVMNKLVELGARLRLHTFMPLPGSPLALAKPLGIHPRYKRAITRLLGKGVLEGYWEEQEEWAKKIYCLMASDPAPTPEPSPLYAPECSTETVSFSS